MSNDDEALLRALIAISKTKDMMPVTYITATSDKDAERQLIEQRLKMEADGYELACVSNAGTPPNTVRLTWLAHEAFERKIDE